MNWTDELVKEFAKVTTEGAYGMYYGCKTIDSKLEKFKEVVSNRPHRKVLVTLTKKYYKSTDFEVNVPPEIKEDDVETWINENVSCTYMDDKVSEAPLNEMEHNEEIDSDRYDIYVDGKQIYGGHL
jgi:hypothetical protein